MTTLREQIISAYEADQLRPPARTVDELPISYEAITDEWLTAVLCVGTPGAAVVSHQLSAPGPGTTNRRRLSLHYNDTGQQASLPTSVFCKASFGLNNRLMLGRTGSVHGEVTFYNNVRQHIDVDAPVSLFSRYDPVSFNSINILNDLGQDVEFCTHATPMDWERALSQVRLLSRYHARFLRDPTMFRVLKGIPTWPNRLGTIKTIGFCDHVTAGIPASQSVIPPAVYARGDEILSATLECVELHKTMQPTLLHGDVHLGNWYVRNGRQMGLADWQIVCLGHWSRDLSYTVSTALTTENRRAWEQDLIKAYLEFMAEEGAPTVSFDEAWLLYRSQLFAAMAFWLATLTPGSEQPDMQPEATSTEFIRRTSHAIEDLDSFAALRQVASR